MCNIEDCKDSIKSPDKCQGHLLEVQVLVDLDELVLALPVPGRLVAAGHQGVEGLQTLLEGRALEGPIDRRFGQFHDEISVRMEGAETRVEYISKTAAADISRQGKRQFMVSMLHLWLLLLLLL